MRIIFASLVSLLALSSVATAADSSQYGPTNQGDLAIYAGQLSALRDSRHESFEAGAEYRFADVYHGLHPTVGVLTDDDGALYGYGGIAWDLPLGIAPIIITPGFDIGGYSQGDSKDLGYGIEFRSTLEATYRFDDGQRFGGSISHLSNAGLGDKNPGTETLQVVYSHPI